MEFAGRHRLDASRMVFVEILTPIYNRFRGFFLVFTQIFNMGGHETLPRALLAIAGNLIMRAIGMPAISVHSRRILNSGAYGQRIVCDYHAGEVTCCAARLDADSLHLNVGRVGRPQV